MSKTALGVDGVKPTDYQIRSGHIVVPKEFYRREVNALDWAGGFTVVAFGERTTGKRIDYDRRLTLRLKDRLAPGEVLRLSIVDGELFIEKV